MTNKPESNKSEGRRFKLIIDKKPYEWQEEYITGDQIKKMANIAAENELFLKVVFSPTDQVILSDTRVDLAKQGIEYFYSRQKSITLIINGREKPWSEKAISFEELIVLAFGKVSENPNTVFTVTYTKGPEKNYEGSLVKRDKIFTKNKMIFNVTATDKS
jgi:hypothetical protein